MKSLFASKTFWTNALSLVAMIATAGGYTLPAAIATPEAQAITIGTITTIANIILRTVTSEPVSIMGGVAKTAAGVDKDTFIK